MDVKIVKMGSEAPPPVKKAGKTRGGKHPPYGILKGGKTARRKARFEAVADPAKAPPMKRSNKLRIITEKGAKTRRAKIVDDARKMPISRIRHTLRKNGLPIKDSTPEKLTRKIYEDAQ